MEEKSYKVEVCFYYLLSIVRFQAKCVEAASSTPEKTLAI